MMRAWLFPLRQRPAQSVSPEDLDAWETRPLIISSFGDTQVLRETGAKEPAKRSATGALIERENQPSNVMETIS